MEIERRLVGHRTLNFQFPFSNIQFPMPLIHPSPLLPKGEGTDVAVIPDLEVLSEISLFRNLTREELAQLSALMRCASFPARAAS